MIRRLPVPGLCVLLVLASGAGRARAGEPEIVSESEAAAAAAELRGDSVEAQKQYAKALLLAAESMEATDTEEASDALAGRVEFLAEKAALLARRTGEVASATEVLARAEARTRRAGRPLLAARLAFLLGEAEQARGRAPEAAAAWSRLGFVTEWLVIGPFDNERGAGYRTPYGPENAIDPAAVYDGKLRRIAWRRAVRARPDGYVDLAAMLRPNKEALAYALVFVKSKETRTIALRFASDDSIQVWACGERVFHPPGDRETQRSCTFDQDAFGLVLAKGWNAILLKVTQREGAWGFRLRVTGPDGSPAKGLTFSVDPPKKINSVAPPEPPMPIARGALSRYRGLALAGRRDPVLYLRLGFLERMRAAHHVEDHRVREAYRRALALTPPEKAAERARLLYEYAFVASPPARVRAEANENPMREALEGLLRIRPEAAEAETMLARHYLRAFGNMTKAAAHARRALGRNPACPSARLVRAEMFDRTGWPAEAEAELKRVLESLPNSPGAHQGLAKLRAKRGDLAGAIAHYEAALRSAAVDRDLGRAYAGTLARAGKTYKALAQHEACTRRDPYAVEAHLARAVLFEAQDDLKRAAAACRAALAIAPEEGRALTLLGRVLDESGKDKEAREAWTEALRVQPNNVALEGYLEFRAGEASYDEVHRAKAAPYLKMAARTESDTNDPAVYLLRRRLVRLRPDGTRSVTSHEIIKILNERGARAFQEIPVSYDASEQRARFKTARVVHPDASEEQARIATAGSRRGRARLRAAFPPLKSGDVIEVESRIDDLRQSFFGDYFGNVFYFRSGLPTRVASYVLLAPAGRRLYFNRKNGAPEAQTRRLEDEKSVLRDWEMRDLAKVPAERNAPPLREVSPAVEVSTYRDWAGFGRWYWNLIKDQHTASPEIRAKVAEITRGARTEMEKIEAVYGFVTSRIRYNMWEFGIHGFKPYRAGTILQNGFGDCKDKSTLMNTMLGVLDIEAWPVLIRSEIPRGAEDLTLPLIGHFNHCISYVPPGEGHGELWLDGTASFSGLSEIPYSDRGASVAVIRPDGARLTTIPHGTAKENRSDEIAEIFLDAKGHARLNTRLTVRGTRAAMVRLHLREASRQALQLERVYGAAYPGAKVRKVRVDPISDPRRPPTILASIDVPGFARAERGGLVFLPPVSPIGQPGTGRLTQYAETSRRALDLVVPYPWRYTARVTFHAPEGYVFLRPENAALEGPYGRVSLTYELKDNVLTLDQDLRLTVVRVKANDYPAFSAFCAGADRLRSRILILRPAKPAGGGE